MDGSNKVNAESRKTKFKMVGDLDRNGNPLHVFLPGKSHGQRSLVGYSPWGRRVEHN